MPLSQPVNNEGVVLKMLAPCPKITARTTFSLLTFRVKLWSRLCSVQPVRGGAAAASVFRVFGLRSELFGIDHTPRPLDLFHYHRFLHWSQSSWRGADKSLKLHVFTQGYQKSWYECLIETETEAQAAW